VAESALVYIARHRNLMVSIFTLCLQVALSFVFVELIRRGGWPEAYQAVGPALALATALTVSSVIKTFMLSRMLGAGVVSLRPGMLAAMIAAAGTGVAISKLPEWAQMTGGIIAMLVVYFALLFKLAFGPEDRALFKRMPSAEERIEEVS
jgi:hypothetical protein